MRRNSIIKLIPIFIALGITSCLDQNTQNLPPGGGGGSMIVMTYNVGINSANTNSGLVGTAFSAGALTFPISDDADSVAFNALLQGPTMGKNITVTLKIDTTLHANYAVDSIDYEAMPDSVYDFLPSSSGVIQAGKTNAAFWLKVYPSKIDATKSYMLPITCTNDANVTLATNVGTIFVHTIGNPIAGPYSWDFIRCSTPSCSAGPDGLTFYGHSTLMLPVNTTKIRVKMGYYDGPDYIVSFTGGDLATLSNFKVVIDPVAITGSWASAGIVVASGPTITPENGNTKFTMHFTTATRNCTDVYYK